MNDIEKWFVGRLPDEWFTNAPTVTVDREEILVVGEIAAPEGDASTEGAEGRAARFREETRGVRMRIADEAEQRFARKVSWGVRCGEHSALFTTVSAPVMTRLRQPERQVLDTLVEAGVARSRSDALGWCVRLVGRHEQDWIGRLQDALTEVRRLREDTPG